MTILWGRRKTKEPEISFFRVNRIRICLFVYDYYTEKLDLKNIYIKKCILQFIIVSDQHFLSVTARLLQNMWCILFGKKKNNTSQKWSWENLAWRCWWFQCEFQDCCVSVCEYRAATLTLANVVNPTSVSWEQRATSNILKEEQKKQTVMAQFLQFLLNLWHRLASTLKVRDRCLLQTLQKCFNRSKKHKNKRSAMQGDNL